ncbi:LOW QUALITY PROTEIN: urotensin-2 receptor-like [Rhinatrema bivittatum]|uniref:LOW QUALITY PROTEIN: urotensin-2 receptor-like n=1 Tax=Rhinatrema bivittatum TaxID=194408 RepID=UPI00112A3E8D|nr:LOW QUALITY PROTEIN: urotensin-2 receptor-like [Rhinatrema bivittatum]
MGTSGDAGLDQGNFSAAAGDDYNPALASTIGAALLSLLGVAGVAGNLYTLAVARSSGGATSASVRVHVANLALADLLYLATVPFVVHNSLAGDWHFGEAGCRVLLTLDLLTMHASSFTLTAMSAERYLAVAKPFHALRRARGSYRKTFALATWLLAFFLTMPIMAMIRQEERLLVDGGTRRLCTPAWSHQHSKAYLTILFATSILIPGVTIGYLYAKLARAYWSSQTKNLLNKELRRNPRHKVVLMTFIIVLAFWACFLPFWAWQLVPLYSHHLAEMSERTEVCVNSLVTCLTYGNSCINPFLYTLLSRNYREYRRKRLRGPGPGAQHGTETGTVSQL